MTSRREFIGGAAAMAAVGCTTRTFSPLQAKGEMRAFLLHLGHNMWCDWYPDDFDLSKLSGTIQIPDAKLRSKEPLWRQTTEYLAAKGCNTLVIDIGEALVYPSHPELAVEGSYTPDQMRDEIRRLNALGMEVIPKLNFSTTHNGWMKMYRHMVSTPQYYRFCDEVIADIAEVFQTPRYMHIGYDEERAGLQEGSHARVSMAIARSGTELWKFDFLKVVRAVEKNGMRPIAWSDYHWDHPEFAEWCPKSVVMNNWYYDMSNGGFELAQNKTADHKMLKCFYDLDKAGFDQIPCGTTWVGSKRKQLGIGADDVIGKLVKTMRRDMTPKHLMGFMMAPWCSCDTEENVQKNLHAMDLFAETFKS